MNYSGISECDVLNGSGFRVVLFVSGCDLNCYNCHNPKTHNPSYGYEYTTDTEDYIIQCLNKPYIDGITLTGGHPLYKDNISTIDKLIDRIKLETKNKTIWLYSGYTWEYIKTRPELYNIIKKIDVLVDGAYIDSERDLMLKFRGSKNQRLIDVNKTIKSKKICVIK